MFNCFKKRQRPIKPETMIVKSAWILGIVVGHNEKAQGAVNYLGESEFQFNSRIAKKLQFKLREKGIISNIIFRPVGSYSYQVSCTRRDLHNSGCTHSLHLHFNSASSNALGCEVLLVDTLSAHDNLIADIITDKLNERFNFHERGQDGLRILKQNHNGFRMLKEISDSGLSPVLVEPCFAHYRNAESALIFEKEDLYVNVLCDSYAELFLSILN